MNFWKERSVSRFVNHTDEELTNQQQKGKPLGGNLLQFRSFRKV